MSIDSRLRRGLLAVGLAVVVLASGCSREEATNPVRSSYPGEIYVAGFGSNSLYVVRPNGDAGRATVSQLDVGPRPVSVTPVPNDVPNAGAVIVTNFGNPQDPGTLSVVQPSGTVSTVNVGSGPILARIGPSGTPNAGDIYVANYGHDGQGDTITRVSSDLRSSATIKVCVGPTSMAIVGEGPPDAGTVFIACEQGSVAIVTPQDGVNIIPLRLKSNGVTIFRSAPRGISSAIFAGDANGSGYAVEVDSSGSEVKRLKITSDLPHQPIPGKMDGAPGVYFTQYAGGKAKGALSFVSCDLKTSEQIFGKDHTVIAVTSDQALDDAIYVSNSSNAADRPAEQVTRLADHGNLTNLEVGRDVLDISVAPANAPNAGWVYVLNGSGGGPHIGDPTVPPSSSLTQVVAPSDVQSSITGLGPNGTSTGIQLPGSAAGMTIAGNDANLQAPCTATDD